MLGEIYLRLCHILHPRPRFPARPLVENDRSRLIEAVLLVSVVGCAPAVLGYGGLDLIRKRLAAAPARLTDLAALTAPFTVDRFFYLLLDDLADLVLHGAHTEPELLLLELPQLTPLLKGLLAVLPLARQAARLIDRQDLEDLRQLLNEDLVVIRLVLVLVASLLPASLLVGNSLSAGLRKGGQHPIGRVFITAAIDRADGRLLSLHDCHVRQHRVLISSPHRSHRLHVNGAWCTIVIKWHLLIDPVRGEWLLDSVRAAALLVRRCAVVFGSSQSLLRAVLRHRLLLLAVDDVRLPEALVAEHLLRHGVLRAGKWALRLPLARTVRTLQHRVAALDVCGAPASALHASPAHDGVAGALLRAHRPAPLLVYHLEAADILARQLLVLVSRLLGRGSTLLRDCIVQVAVDHLIAHRILGLVVYTGDALIIAEVMRVVGQVGILMLLVLNAFGLGVGIVVNDWMVVLLVRIGLDHLIDFLLVKATSHGIPSRVKHLLLHSRILAACDWRRLLRWLARHVAQLFF